MSKDEAFAMRVCELSVEWFNPGLHDIEQPTEVTVLGSDRDPLVHRPVDGFCERA